MNLDETDLKILESLHKNSRLTNKELAAICGLAPSSTLSRLRSLQKAKIIKRFTVEIDPRSLGIEIQAMLSIRIQVHSNKLFEAFYRYLDSLTEVISVYHTSGTIDLLVHIVVRDSNHLRDFVLENISNRDEVRRCETSLIYDQKQRNDLTHFLEKKKNH